MHDFERRFVWQRTHQLTLEIYRLTTRFPAEERFGLVSQLRRSAASVPANIAEGTGRDSPREFVRFLRIASGSASETRYHLILSRDLGWIAVEEFTRLNREIDEIRRMLTALIRRNTKA